MNEKIWLEVAGQLTWWCYNCVYYFIIWQDPAFRFPGRQICMASVFDPWEYLQRSPTSAICSCNHPLGLLICWKAWMLQRVKPLACGLPSVPFLHVKNSRIAEEGREGWHWDHMWRWIHLTVMTLFLLLLLLWTLELYLILSYRYEDLLISWSYWSYPNDLILAILSHDLRSYLDLLILSSDDDPWYVSLHELYIITYMHLTCLWFMSFIDDRHAFYTCCCATCFYLTLDMLWTYVLHVFALRTTHGH